MRHSLFLILFAAMLFGVNSYSNEPKGSEHKHEEGEAEEHGEHAEESHDHGKEHGEHGEEEARPSVGPEKGILEANEHDGFKLSPEAIKNFELKVEMLNGSGPWPLPTTALLLSGEERNIYRLREGFYKRIDFTSGPGSAEKMIVQSKDLKPGDEVVIRGLGFLRIAELAAFGGAPEGHSH